MHRTKHLKGREHLSDKEMIGRLDEILAGYKNMDGAIIPVLQTAQNMFGYLSKPVLMAISRKLKQTLQRNLRDCQFYSFSQRFRGANTWSAYAWARPVMSAAAKEFLKQLKRTGH